ncbi:MAG: DNA mismatch repair protein MutS [Flavobacteriales bacterium]|nr:DNA mismatch repair protein MutS [Flavobacteriales bacterium]
MKQYNSIKAKYPDALLLFRVGDFYEMFGDDAVKASKILGIVLTKRKNGAAAYVDLAGFPHHSLDSYLPKLVRAGNRVAICDQLEDPKATKNIVKRGVTELVTPGVSYNEKVLDTRKNNFLAAVAMYKNLAGVAFVDVSTGEFLTAEGTVEYIDKLIQSFNPNEILHKRHEEKEFAAAFGEQFYTYRLDDWVFSEDFGRESLLKHFQTASLKGFGIDEMSLGIVASGAVLHYLGQTKHNDLGHISNISRIAEHDYVWLDKFTIRNLELVWSAHEDATTLHQVLDHTITPMGARLLKRWIVLPLIDKTRINDRLDVVEYLSGRSHELEQLAMEMKHIGDLERLVGKVATTRINPKELSQLKKGLNAIVPVRDYCLNSDNAAIRLLGEQLNACAEVREKIDTWLEDDPPLLLSKGGVIRTGIDGALDEFRKLAYSGKDYLLEIQQRESEITGIPSLKIAYNNVFGYYLEVRNAHKDKVPDNWIRKQTLTQAERYITEELKEYESKILSAEERIGEIEAALFNQLIAGLMDHVGTVQINSQIIAKIDCLLSFAKIALKNNYVRPSLNDEKSISIKDGRHPVIERKLPVDQSYVSNDIYLDNDTQQILMITGPNMSGKSALLRQTALIVLMAQMGCFVPAKSADIGLVDKVFTRVGASDNISSGESTFMVEMNETASILNNLSDRSLILLDEIGRGTSTYDGISIAWAIAEFLHQHPSARAKTLFATHYHELNDMSDSLPRIKNFNVAVKEVGNKVIFLRKLTPGGSNHSFGIHVARMAGIPGKVITRANEVLKHLEKTHASTEKGRQSVSVDSTEKMQLSFFQLDDPVLQNIKDELLATDINTLTPVEALMKLNEIRKMVGG